MRRLLLAGILLLVRASFAWAQQDPQFTQYMFNNLYYNPGFSGVEGVTKITALHRSQWLGYAPTYGDGGAPTTQLITFTTPIYKLNSGFGSYIVHDNLANFNNLEAQASYAYHLGIKNSKLSFGVRAGIFSQTINTNFYRSVDPEGFENQGSLTQIKPDLAAGVFWRKEKFYVGTSFNHLTGGSFNFGKGISNPLQTHGYFTAGYTHEVNFDLKFLFTTLVQSDFVKTTTNLSAIAYLKDTMWGGLSFRQGDAAILMFGYSFFKDKSMKLGYSLDYIIKNQAAKQPTSHEFMLTYELPTSPGAGKKVVRTPRYRH
ncbi:MAG: type IX secretion system membrane protein PorP/SprF [Bacteroidetes bacterium]|nr:type IX secretion system membrane protein PorP/SprF [Bacteroidota bacterium]MBS1540575.1 type IX secretion system membrane protein PorP/SprF [Bacteroidota bacterium]